MFSFIFEFPIKFFLLCSFWRSKIFKYPKLVQFDTIMNYSHFFLLLFFRTVSLQSTLIQVVIKIIWRYQNWFIIPLLPKTSVQLRLCWKLKWKILFHIFSFNMTSLWSFNFYYGRLFSLNLPALNWLLLLLSHGLKLIE